METWGLDPPRLLHNTKQTVQKFNGCNDVLLSTRNPDRFIIDGYLPSPNNNKHKHIPTLVGFRHYSGDTPITYTGSRTESIWSADLSPNGTRLVSGEENAGVEVFDTRSGKELTSFRAYSETEAAGFDWIEDVEFYNGGNKIVTTMTISRTMKFWEAETGELIDTVALRNHPESIDVSEKHDLLVYGSEKSIGFLSLNDLEVLWTDQIHDDSINSVRFSPDGTYIATGSGEDHDEEGFRDYSIKLWKTPNVWD
ncbi:MAG: WD40 repeat domain-containing protein [bacterium]